MVRSRLAFPAVIVLLFLVAAAPARAQQARSLMGDQVEGSLSPWRGSIFAYEHQATAISAWRPALPRWNPYYAHQLSLRPEYHFEKLPLFLRGRFNLTQELTLSDETTYPHEVVWSDFTLEAVVPGWVEPRSGIRFGGNLRVTAPLSKASWAQTLNVGLSPAIIATRGFEVLNGLVLGWGARYAAFFNRSTTTVLDGPRIPCGEPDSPVCQRLSHTGMRNPSWSVSHGPLAVLVVNDRLSLTAVFNQFRTALYPLSPATVPVSGGEVTLDGGGVNARYTNLALLDANFALTSDVSLALGLLTFSGQLAPDGTYQNPVFNRFTSLYFDVLVDVERLSARLRRRAK